MSKKTFEDGGHSLLAEKVREIARGNFQVLDDLYNFSGIPGLSEEVAALAESIGMILVKLEGREFQLQRAEEVENRLKDINQLKNRHLGIAAHDLRNPLTTVFGMSQMLLRMKLDGPTQRSFLESISRVSEQMLKLVDDLLDIAVIESGKFELNLETGNLSGLAFERSDLIKEIAKEKNIRIKKILEKVPNTTFDVGRIIQAIDNLLSNAIKFSPRNSTIIIRCGQNKENLELSIADQGPGIPVDEIDKLFESFQKLSAQPTGGEKSTGLGLSIVKKIIDAHRGTISVNSELGKGTRFTLILPDQARI